MNEELEKLKGDHKLPLSVIIRRTLKYISKEKGWFILSLFMLAINVLLDSISPLFTSRITDLLVEDSINIKLIINLVLLSFAIMCINQFFLYFESIILQRSGQRIIYRLRNEIPGFVDDTPEQRASEIDSTIRFLEVYCETTGLGKLLSVKDSLVELRAKMDVQTYNR